MVGEGWARRRPIATREISGEGGAKRKPSQSRVTGPKSFKRRCIAFKATPAPGKAKKSRTEDSDLDEDEDLTADMEDPSPENPVTEVKITAGKNCSRSTVTFLSTHSQYDHFCPVFQLFY